MEINKITEAYCVKCRKKIEIENPITSKTKRGVNIIRGKCPNCNTNVCRIGG